jgi:hypothetical protein
MFSFVQTTLVDKEVMDFMVMSEVLVFLIYFLYICPLGRVPTQIQDRVK